MDLRKAVAVINKIGRVGKKVWNFLKWLYEGLWILPPIVGAVVTAAFYLAILAGLGLFVYWICGGGMVGGLAAFLLIAISWAMLGL